MFAIENRAELINTKQLTISCVVPVFNEEGLIVDFITALSKQLSELSPHYEIILVNDGSSDNTTTKIQSQLTNPNVKLLDLSRNFGKESAITAGLSYCQGKVVVIIDADFQHPVELIPEFIQQWQLGYDMVYGKRQNREHESIIKRGFTKFFYNLIGKITRIKIPTNAGDFRLLDRKVVQAILELSERNRFMKGLYAWVGFKTKAIPFKVQPRAGGVSSWKFNRLTELAITGITSFSNVPLRVWSLIGFIISFIAFAYAIAIISETMLFGIKVPGYATIVVAIMFFGGIQLFSIGILGEYIARIFNEVKQRPNFIIADKYNFDD